MTPKLGYFCLKTLETRWFPFELVYPIFFVGYNCTSSQDRWYTNITIKFINISLFKGNAEAAVASAEGDVDRLSDAGQAAQLNGQGGSIDTIKIDI